MNRVKFTTNLDKELLQALKVQAAKEGRNVNTILNELISVYLQYVSSKPA